jgi:hypothetical protein
MVFNINIVDVKLSILYIKVYGVDRHLEEKRQLPVGVLGWLRFALFQ